MRKTLLLAVFFLMWAFSAKADFVDPAPLPYTYDSKTYDAVASVRVSDDTFRVYYWRMADMNGNLNLDDGTGDFHYLTLDLTGALTMMSRTYDVNLDFVSENKTVTGFNASLPADFSISSDIVFSQDIYALASEDFGGWLGLGSVTAGAVLFSQNYFAYMDNQIGVSLVDLSPYEVGQEGGEILTLVGVNMPGDFTVTMCGVPTSVIDQNADQLRFYSTSCGYERASVVFASDILQTDYQRFVDISGGALLVPEGDARTIVYDELPSLIDDPTGFFSTALYNMGKWLQYILIPRQGFIYAQFSEMKTAWEAQFADFYAIYDVATSAPETVTEEILYDGEITVNGTTADFVFDPFHSFDIPPIVPTITSFVLYLSLGMFFIRKISNFFPE